jgi:UDP-glucose 4-epimerase
MKYVITGGSGYIGTRLTEFLIGREDTELIAIADLRPPRYPRAKVQFHRTDVRERSQLRVLLERVKPDALVHLAFVLNPMHDEHQMYEIDVGGTQNVLDAASRAGVEHLLVTSSATAYGAFADNPVPLDEEHPVRGVPDFEYARDKAECDRLCQLWALQHPDRTMTIVRPCIVFGPNVDNYILRAWTKIPFQADFGQPSPPMQFVHEEDLVEALVLLLDGRHEGPFNVAGDGTMTLDECSKAIGRRIQRVPLALYWRFVGLMWLVRQSESPPGNLHFVIHPWVVSTERLKQTTGWKPRHSSRETFEITMRANGLLGGGESPAELPEPTVPVGA